MGARAVNIHATAIEKAGYFKEVRTAFWKQEPRLSIALDGITAAKTFIVPVLASRGHITNEILPKELGLKGMSGDKHTCICDPVGAHPLLPDAMSAACENALSVAGLDPRKTSLLLLGHGNAANPASAQQTEKIAENIRQNTPLAQVKTAYLDQEPYATNWQTVISNPIVVAIPFMISGGLHASHDIPEALGILENLKDIESLEDSQNLIGPYASGNKQVWYARPTGCEPFITDLILDQVAKISR